MLAEFRVGIRFVLHGLRLNLKSRSRFEILCS